MNAATFVLRIAWQLPHLKCIPIAACRQTARQPMSILLPLHNSIVCRCACSGTNNQHCAIEGESGECGCKLTAYPSLRLDRTTCRCTVAQPISQKTAVSLRPTHPRARCTSLHNTMSATVSISRCCQCVWVLLHARSARDRMATYTSGHAYRFEKLAC